MSLTNRNSGTHFLNLSAYNRFRRRLTSRRRSDSSISDAQSIQSSQAEEQGVEDVKGKTTAEDPLKVVDRVQKKTGRKLELLTPLPPPKAEEKIFTLSAYNRFRRLTSRRSDSSISDAESIQSSQAEEQGSSGDSLPTQLTEGEILSSPHLKAFTFNELKSATRNFRPDSLIGEGGSGYVFRGWIDEQTFTASEPGVGMVVAVKKLPEGFQGHNEWLTEVRYLGQLHHPNIVKLIGFCSDGDILVYEYMPKESLANHLFRRGPQSLSWATRIKVAIGVAKGLTFLHNAKSQVIHRDVKPSNILLDSDFNAKLSGFGLAMDGPTGDMTEVFTQVLGTQVYAAPEYIGTGRLSSKADVYSFGVVLLKLLSGRRAYDKSKSDTEGNLVEWARPYLGDKRMLFCIMDSKLEGQFPEKVAHAMANLVSLCIGNNPKLRPRMSEVLAVLEKLQDREEIDNETAENLSKLNVQNFRAEEDPKVHLGQLKMFSLRELRVATDSFSNKNILGRGGFGKVYKGRLTDGSLVAVKRLKEKRTKGEELQFQTEVEMISMAVHQKIRNLLCLRGFCMTPTEWLLVYPYMANGSVASCLRERPPSEPPLDWPTRRRIALGSARGLWYLHDHCDPKIIHRDVKASNILLDEEFEAVVGDFSLAILMDCKDTHVTTDVRGTVGHIAPEYYSTGEASEKTDVFGYGIMLLELITGQRAFDLARLANDDDVMLLDWVKKGLLQEKRLELLVDPDLQNNYVEPEVESLIQVALLCTQFSPMERPKMWEVVRMLEGYGLAERWEEWQKVEVRQEVEMAPRNTEWILDSTDNLPALELSGPR